MPHAAGNFGEVLPLRRLYEWDPFMRFIEAVLERGVLYRYADPLGALNLAVMGDGDELQWHFDMTDFVVSLALQDADEGGDFEVAPRIRSAADERYDAVGRVLRGELDDVIRLPMTPGTLLIFEGRHWSPREPHRRRHRPPGRSPRLRHETRHLRTGCSAWRATAAPDDRRRTGRTGDALYGVETARALANLAFSRHRLGDYPIRRRARGEAAAAAANRAMPACSTTVARRQSIARRQRCWSTAGIWWSTSSAAAARSAST
jgi:hypothetical protein